MGRITSGIGLISGMDTASIIEQLMALESRPKTVIENRNKRIEAQQEGLQEIRTALLGLKDLAQGLTLPTAFTKTQGTSSNEAVVGITSRAGAIRGNYNFVVNRLVSSQQTISRGYANRDVEPIAPAGGTLTFDRGEARLETDTLLSDLNGGAGISRGLIRVTDRSGASAVIDLSAVATVDDLVKKISSTSGVSVAAEVDGDGFKLVDLSGGTGTLAVADVGATGTATSLGLTAAATASGDGTTLKGGRVNTVGEATILSRLNDGNGVRLKPGADLTINVGGTAHEIDLDGAVTVGDVLARIKAGTGDAVSGTISPDGLGITLTGPAGFTVASAQSSGAAEDLGIAGTAAGGTISSSARLIGGINSKLLRNLNGGAGVTLGEIAITNRSGGTTRVDLAGAASVSDVIGRINDAGAGVTASLNSAGNGLMLTDHTGGAGSVSVTDVSGGAAAGLKLDGPSNGAALVGGNLQFKYVTEATRLDKLGVAPGKLRITDSSGAIGVIQINNGAGTIGDIINAINSTGLRVNARVNDNGDGIVIDDTGPGTMGIKVEDDGSTTAKDLGFTAEAAPGEPLVGSFEKQILVSSTDTLTSLAQKIVDAKIGVSATVINDGAPSAPFRLSITSSDPGTAGSFVFDDGGLGLGAQTLAKAQDAVVFYGSDDPAKALVVTSSSNTLNQLIPGATIDLKSTSTQPVQVAISRDDAAITESIQAFVDAFNELTVKIEEVDYYDAETRERGILFGDSTIAIVQQQLYSKITSRNISLTGEFNALAQLGIRVGREAKLEFDAEKFQTALETNPEAVEELFRFKQMEEQPDGTKKQVAAGIGVSINDMLDKLTSIDGGTVQSKIEMLENQVRANEDRIEDLNDRMQQKQARLESQFAAMELALAKMQDNAGALNSLAQLANASRQSR